MLWAPAKEELAALTSGQKGAAKGGGMAACGSKAHDCIVTCDKTKPKDQECKSQCYQAKFACEGR